jgi:hypothetical protein
MGKVIRPLPDRCQIHKRTLFVPVKPPEYSYHIWICIECVKEGYWRDDLTEDIRKNWPAEFSAGPDALKEYLKKESGGAKRKGATGV